MRSLLALALIGTAVMACSQSAPFTLTLRANKSTEVADSQVFVSAKMTNISDHDVDCTEAEIDGTLVSYEYDVRDENGKPIDLRDKSLPYSSPGHTGKHWDKCNLEPGKSREIALIVSFRYDLSKPGKYSIQVARRSSTDSEGFRAGELVRSNTVVVTVLPKAEVPPPAEQ